MRRGLRNTVPDQYDGPWKNFVDEHLSQFIEFFVPGAYEEIDWARKPVSLNTELRRLVLEDVSAFDLSSLRASLSGGESVNPEIVTRWEAMTGCPVMRAAS